MNWFTPEDKSVIDSDFLKKFALFDQFEMLVKIRRQLLDSIDEA